MCLLFILLPIKNSRRTVIITPEVPKESCKTFSFCTVRICGTSLYHRKTIHRLICADRVRLSGDTSIYLEIIPLLIQISFLPYGNLC